MDKFSFGPSDNAINQVAYTVADIEQGMRQYGELLRVGPWCLIGPFVPPKGRYRGAVAKANFSLALVYTGELMIELIAQHDNEPSVFQETLKAPRRARLPSLGRRRARLREDCGALLRAGLSASIYGHRARTAGLPRHLFRHRTRSAGHAGSHRNQRRHGRGLSQHAEGRTGMERKGSCGASRMTMVPARDVLASAHE